MKEETVTKAMQTDRKFVESVLETYGAKPARWPDAVRERMHALIAADADLRALHNEFSALETALDQAIGSVDDSANHQHAALADRIMDQVAREANVVAMPEKRRSMSPTPTRFNRGAGRQALQSPNMAALSTLAASLIVGVFVGSMGTANTVLTPISEALGLGQITTETAALSDPIFDVVDSEPFGDDVL